MNIRNTVSQLWRLAKYLLFVGLMMILFGELIFFLFPFLSAKQPPYDTAVLNDTIGWVPKVNYLYDGPMYDFVDPELAYPIKWTTDERGFRQYPAHKDTSDRIFIIGDSFTQAVEASDDKTFYVHLENHLALPIYAFGMSGYGSLQEYMILDQYLEEINPSIVLLQFCSNDFIDNEIELERNANYRVGLRRPYVDMAGELEYHHPLPWQEALLQRTRFLKFCYGKWLRLKQMFQTPTQKESSEALIGELGKELPAYQEAVHKTALVLKKMLHRLGPSQQLIVFSADQYNPQQTDMANICQEIGIPFIQFPAHLLNDKAVYYVHDGYHWNEAGHRVMGQYLAQQLKQHIANSTLSPDSTASDK